MTSYPRECSFATCLPTSEDQGWATFPSPSTLGPRETFHTWVGLPSCGLPWALWSGSYAKGLRRYPLGGGHGPLLGGFRLLRSPCTHLRSAEARSSVSIPISLPHTISVSFPNPLTCPRPVLPKTPLGPQPDPAFILMALTAVEAEFPRRGRDRRGAGPTSNHSRWRSFIEHPVTEPVPTMLPVPPAQANAHGVRRRQTAAWKVELLAGARARSDPQALL